MVPSYIFIAKYKVLIQGVGMKVNEIDLVPTGFVFYIMIPFSNLAKHKNLPFSIGVTTIFNIFVLINY